MARTWLSIRVELIEGGGDHCRPRPGRILAATRTHIFPQLAEAIDDAFARWDRAHLCQSYLADGARLALPDPDWDEPGETLDYRRVKLSRLARDEQSVYVFDLSDYWAHLCTVGAQRIDPEQALGIVPAAPLPYWGWGSTPDRYGRRFDGDDGESRLPKDPRLADLPGPAAGVGTTEAARRSGVSPGSTTRRPPVFGPEVWWVMGPGG